jgi:hypothetical protein
VAGQTSSSTAGGGSNTQWSIIVSQGDQRTLTAAQIADLYAKGTVNDTTYVWRDGMSGWAALGTVAELKAAMGSGEPSLVEEVSALMAAPDEMDDSLPTQMVQSPMAMMANKGPSPAAGRAPAPQPAAPRPPAPQPPAPQPPAPQPPAPQPPAPQPPAAQAAQFQATMASPNGGFPAPQPMMAPELSVSAARRPGPARPDLMQAAHAADPALAQATGAPAPRPAQPTAPRMQNQGGQLVFSGMKEGSMLNVSTQFFMAQLESPRRKKRLFAILGVGVVGLGVGIVVAAKLVDSKEQSGVEHDWSKLSACVLGAEALKPNETVSQRVRNVQLAVLGTPLEKRAKPGESSWPARCAADAHSLREHARSSGKAFEPLAASTEVLAKALQEDPSATIGVYEQAEKVWADAAKLNLKAGTIPDAAPAPKPVSPLSDDAFKALPKFLSGTFTLGSIHPAFAGGSLQLVIDQQDFTDGPQVCTIGQDGQARCRKAPAAAAKLSPGLRLEGSVDEGAKPFLFAGDHGQLGMFRPENGEQVAAVYVEGASSRKDGSASVLARAGKDLKLLYRPATGAGNERPLYPGSTVSDPTSSAGLFFDWIAVRTAPKATPPSRLLFRKLSDNGGDAGPTIDVGEIEEAPPGDGGGKGAKGKPATEADAEREVVACRAGETTAVRMRGLKNDAVSIFQADRWSPPLKSATKGGLFTCRKGEAITTQVTPVMEQEKNWAQITQARCNVSGCQATTVGMKDLIPNLVEVAPGDARAVQAVDVDGKLLVVWNAGYLGGIRMRIGPAGSLKDGEDTVLVDARDLKNTMKLSTITELRLLPAGNAAILFISSTTGVRALKIDSTGASTPVQVTVQ